MASLYGLENVGYAAVLLVSCLSYRICFTLSCGGGIIQGTFSTREGHGITDPKTAGSMELAIRIPTKESLVKIFDGIHQACFQIDA